MENEFFRLHILRACWERIYVDINWGYQHFSSGNYALVPFILILSCLLSSPFRSENKKYKDARSADEWWSDDVIRRARFYHVWEQNGLGWGFKVFSVHTRAMWCDIFGRRNTWTCVRCQGMSLDFFSCKIINFLWSFMQMIASSSKKNPIKL